jgi:hypothetical protein
MFAPGYSKTNTLRAVEFLKGIRKKRSAGHNDLPDKTSAGMIFYTNNINPIAKSGQINKMITRPQVFCYERPTVYIKDLKQII